MIKVRYAKKSEMDWINQRYDEVQFVHSDYDHEILAVAEYEGERAGLGRLTQVDEQNLELSGIYVFLQFRGKGIAKEIVEFLLSYVSPKQVVHCIPFEHLVNFYEVFWVRGCRNRSSSEKGLGTYPNKFFVDFQDYFGRFSIQKRGVIFFNIAPRF